MKIRRAAMNKQQLAQVLDGIQEATAFQPGESKQLVPQTIGPAQSLRDAAKDLHEKSLKMVENINRTADDLDEHLRKVTRFDAVVGEAWRKEIEPDKE